MEDFNSKHTGEEVENILDSVGSKQDAISDLQTIREGAAKGATSVQPSDIEDVARKDSGYVMANGILDENDGYWYLPKNSLNDKEHTLASKSDIEEKILVIGDSSDEAKANFIAVANGEKTADIYIGSVDVEGDIIEGCVKLAMSGSSSNRMYSFAIIGNPTSGRYINKLIKVTCRLVNGEISSEVNVIGTYSKPSTGIPKTDLENDVQNALNKAENAASKDKVGDMDVLPTQGFFEQSNGAVYALPNSSTGDEDDILLSRDTVKTINGESIFGSGNIEISGGGSSSGGSGAYSEVNHGTSDTTFSLTPNTFHIWDEVASLTLDLGSETSGVANEYLFQFTSGATATSLTLPDDIKWVNDAPPTIESNMIYQVSILKGLASVLEFSNAASKIDNFLTYASNNISFQYPVASEVTVVFYGRPEGAAASSAPTNVTLVYAVGEQTKGYKTVFNIVSITPSEDDTYNYLF